MQVLFFSGKSCVQEGFRLFFISIVFPSCICRADSGILLFSEHWYYNNILYFIFVGTPRMIVAWMSVCATVGINTCLADSSSETPRVSF